MSELLKIMKIIFLKKKKKKFFAHSITYRNYYFLQRALYGANVGLNQINWMVHTLFIILLFVI